MVYLCVQAWLWYDEAVRKVYNDKMSEDLYPNYKKKKYMLSKCPFKKKTEGKEKEKGSTPEWIVQYIIVHNPSWWGAFVEP